MATIMIKATEVFDKDQQLWINPDQIIRMSRKVLNGPDGKDAEGTEVLFKDRTFAFVIEHPEEIIRRINWAAAKSDQVQCGLMSSFLEREEQMAEEKANAEGVSNHNPEG